MLFSFIPVFDVVNSTLLGSTVHPSTDTNSPKSETSILKSCYLDELIFMSCFLKLSNTDTYQIALKNFIHVRSSTVAMKISQAMFR